MFFKWFLISRSSAKICSLSVDWFIGFVLEKPVIVNLKSSSESYEKCACEIQYSIHNFQQDSVSFPLKARAIPVSVFLIKLFHKEKRKTEKKKTESCSISVGGAVNARFFGKEFSLFKNHWMKIVFQKHRRCSTLQKPIAKANAASPPIFAFCFSFLEKWFRFFEAEDLTLHKLIFLPL